MKFTNTFNAASIAAPREAWPINEATYRLGISRALIYKLHRAGSLRLVKIANRTLVPNSEIERLISGEAA